MRFSRDRRGQSVVVGTVILFGFLIVALGIFQIQVVPTENANVEFEHSQAVEDDFGDLRNDVLRAGATGSTGSTQIRLGTRYPPRTFFINPPPVSGSLSTEPTGSIRVRNATIGAGAHENVARFWNTSPAFETRSLRYTADYNEFDGAPELVYEHSVVAAEFDDAVLLQTGQTAVSGERISLTALSGSVSESGVAPQSVDPRAVSASDTTVPLDPTSGNVTLELPTAVDNATALAARWDDRLPSGATAAPNATGDAVRITLPNGSDPYRLALSEVSLDTTGTTEPAYIVPVGPESVAFNDTVVVEARDKYNNPVPDTQISVIGDERNKTTNNNGRAFFNANRTSFTVAINGTLGPTYESVVFDVSSGNAAVGQTYDIEWNEVDLIQFEEGTSNKTIDISVSDAASGDPLDDAAVDVSFTPIGTVSGVPTFVEPDETDQNGQTNLTEFDITSTSAGDNFTLYATSGDDVDTLRVGIIESTTMFEIVSVDPQPAGGNSIEVTFDIDTTDPDAQVNVQSIRANGNVRDETGQIDVAGSQPQTVTINGANQAVEVRVILFDGAGNEQDRQEEPYP